MNDMQDKPPPSGLSAAGRGLFRDARRFFETELWDRDLDALPRMRQLLFALCRVAIIVVKGFLTDKCGLQASALTYITLMSMVPMMALMFSFSKGIGLQNRLIESIGLERHETVQTVDGREVVDIQFTIAMPPENGTGEPYQEGIAMGLHSLPEPAQRVVVQIFGYVENTHFGRLGMASLFLIFWAVLDSVSRVEHSFNQIWGVSKPRPLLRKVCDYFFVLVLIPVVFLVATSATAMLESPAVTDHLKNWVGPLYALYQKLIRLSGFVLVGFAFSFLYLFMPNTKVKLFPALVAGFVTALLWFITQFAYIRLQVGLTKFNAIYGTFAALPFFLAWLYANWTLILFGAEVGFAIQHHETYVFESATAKIPAAARVALGIACVHEAARNFLHGEGPWSAMTYSRRNKVPARLVLEVCRVLAEAGILVPVEEREARYLPGRDIALLNPGDVEEAFRGQGERVSRDLFRLLPEQLVPAFVAGYDDYADRLRQTSFRSLAAETPENDEPPEEDA